MILCSSSLTLSVILNVNSPLSLAHNIPHSRLLYSSPSELNKTTELYSCTANHGSSSHSRSLRDLRPVAQCVCCVSCVLLPRPSILCPFAGPSSSHSPPLLPLLCCCVLSRRSVGCLVYIIIILNISYIVYPLLNQY